MSEQKPTGSKDSDSDVDVLVVDWHGGLRGKRLPSSMRSKIEKGQARIPISTQAMDVWGDDRDEITGLGLSVGDPDGICVSEPDDIGFHPQPWNKGNEQILCSLHKTQGQPSEFDVRSILNRTVKALNEDKLFPVVAVELEFYLLDGSTASTGVPSIPKELTIAGKPDELQLYDMRVMDRVSDLLKRIQNYSAAMGIPAETSLAEFGPGQFEINLKHQSNPVRAADHAVLFKQLVDRAAHEHGLFASFMAKPYTEHGGSGQHVHVSLLNERGDNVFDQTNPSNQKLLHAANGCLELMSESQLIFAPHANSYRRLQPDSFAPVRCDWGYDHRGVAVRLPETHGNAARLEHRVAGADANPYLVLATLLGSVHEGLKNGQCPTAKPLQPNETSTGALLTHDWITAINNFEQSTLLKRILGEKFCEVFIRVKRHEAKTFNRQVSDIDLASYLTRV